MKEVVFKVKPLKNVDLKIFLNECIILLIGFCVVTNEFWVVFNLSVQQSKKKTLTGTLFAVLLSSHVAQKYNYQKSSMHEHEYSTLNTNHMAQNSYHFLSTTTQFFFLLLYL